ncbi:conserved hypothetical protein [Desulfofarcimen acetoxidans DSM 771]|uniref:Uncharacterized protein n=1 Tax=Desulfofarcimen acetoxidans (strain ATCC 49208 / DSM 771 / KCTC 5769 / VKM B-1644 / 5575) TaxID=485916 RepID=C8W4W5_DESAS|nr:conserved hypothetical protein [Desulfofarcimen acetoxidans DSM 771]
MWKLINKKIIFLFIIIVIILLQFSVIQKAVARLSTTLYVCIKYSDRDIQYQYIEYVPQFGDYFVAYEDKNGESISFMVTPKIFPILILYDPLNRPM